MELKVYSIRDAKGDLFNPPFFKHTHGEAEREFTTVTRDEKSQIFHYPEDFDLYYLGTYDNVKGLFKPLDTPQHITKAVNVKTREN